ncbi:MAG: amidinotransferase [Desulfomicrobium sp.]|nr:amidinotransferase [Pseudomonadota bacterium]MBV1713594.1 amidinotransferase [Desulfomicrobium sp.]MBU4572130.1 amidinotransferase [Pseudomonadota bacterium]MBU4594108.1 amidinotransferase [Pseudomonadota bacterium]MBV1720941.1 amidinotransferase [Desulfomicrobium sp.]
MFSHAIARIPGPDYPQGLTTSTLPAPDLDLALAQHDAYVRCLKSLGLTVDVLPPAPGFPDACFVEDTAVVVREVAVVSRPGAPSRQGEADSMVEPLSAHRPLARITDPGTLDGGDILQVDKRFFIGVSDRTNEEGARQLAAILAGHGYQSDIIHVAAGLHLKSSLNYVGENTMLVTADFAGHPAIKGFRQIVCPEGEEYAANTLLVNGTLIMPSGYPRTRALLETLGLPIAQLDTSEYRKMDGGLTCLSLRLESPVS